MTLDVVRYNIFFIVRHQRFEFEPYSKVLYRRRRSKPSFWFGLILFLIGFFLIIISLNIYNPSLVPNQLRVVSLNKKVNILLLGCDEVFPGGVEAASDVLWKGRSDAIIVVGCNPFKNSLNILNIPRDTKIKLQGYGAEKINFLNSIAGPIVTKKGLEKLLRIHIDNYVVVNLQGLNKMIDEMGGIIIDVPQRMQYRDYTGMVDINLFPGNQHLNGKQAVDFLRFRHDSLADIGRIQRQQEFIRAVVKKLIDPVTFTKLPGLANIYKQTINTDLKARDIIRIANFIRNVPTSNQNIVILPGEFGQRNQISYWIPNQKEISNIVRKFFYDGKDFFRFVRTDPEDIKISVINASNKDRMLGTKLTNLLREYGYTVLLAQDYEIHESMTKIYAQKANSEQALQVKYDIGNFGELLTGNLGPPDADVTILAGDDLANSNEVRKRRL